MGSYCLKGAAAEERSFGTVRDTGLTLACAGNRPPGGRPAQREPCSVQTAEQLGKTRLKTVLWRQESCCKTRFRFPRQVLILLGFVNTEDRQCLPGKPPPPSPATDVPSVPVRLSVAQDVGARGGAGRAADHLHPPATGEREQGQGLLSLNLRRVFFSLVTASRHST